MHIFEVWFLFYSTLKPYVRSVISVAGRLNECYLREPFGIPCFRPHKSFPQHATSLCGVHVHECGHSVGLPVVLWVTASAVCARVCVCERELVMAAWDVFHCAVPCCESWWGFPLRTCKMILASDLCMLLCDCARVCEKGREKDR